MVLKSRSTCTSLLEFVNFSAMKIEEGDQVDVIILILERLSTGFRRIGVKSNLLAWIQTYLCDREQFYKVCGWTSNPIKVTFGVSQGSHLGP